jgi:hypothetical protein
MISFASSKGSIFRRGGGRLFEGGSLFLSSCMFGGGFLVIEGFC